MTEEFLVQDNGKSNKERPIKLELDRKSAPSVFYVNYRSLYPDNYSAKFDDEFASFLIQHYSDEGETVLDPFGGSGTIPLKATELNRNAVAIDINKVATDLIEQKYKVLAEHYRLLGQLDIRNVDSRRIPYEDNCIDFILTSPPFGLSIDAAHDKYSDIKADLGNSDTYEQWRIGHKQVMKECLRILKPERLMGIEIRPRSKDGHSYPLFSWIVQDAEDLGFEFYTEYIEIVTPYKMWTMGQDKARKAMPNHCYMLIFKKPDAALNAKLL